MPARSSGRAVAQPAIESEHCQSRVCPAFGTGACKVGTTFGSNTEMFFTRGRKAQSCAGGAASGRPKRPAARPSRERRTNTNTTHERKHETAPV